MPVSQKEVDSPANARDGGDEREGGLGHARRIRRSRARPRPFSKQGGSGRRIHGPGRGRGNDDV